jgi:hypothetical protein
MEAAMKQGDGWGGYVCEVGRQQAGHSVYVLMLTNYRVADLTSHVTCPISHVVTPCTAYSGLFRTKKIFFYFSKSNHELAIAILGVLGAFVVKFFWGRPGLSRIVPDCPTFKKLFIFFLYAIQHPASRQKLPFSLKFGAQ